MEMKKQGINVQVDKEQYAELKRLRKQIGIPVAESVRRAIKEYLGKVRDDQKEAEINKE